MQTFVSVKVTCLVSFFFLHRLFTFLTSPLTGPLLPLRFLVLQVEPLPVSIILSLHSLKFFFFRLLWTLLFTSVSQIRSPPCMYSTATQLIAQQYNPPCHLHLSFSSQSVFTLLASLQSCLSLLLSLPLSTSLFAFSLTNSSAPLGYIYPFFFFFAYSISLLQYTDPPFLS